MPPPPPPTPECWTKITNVGSNECIPKEFDAEVCYTNATTANARLTVSCSGATVTPSFVDVGPGSASVSFHVSHGAAGMGHSLIARMTDLAATVLLASDEVGVSVGDPCPITITPTEGSVYGLPQLGPTKDLSGEFQPKLGNRVMLIVGEPMKIVDNKLKRGTVTFVDPAKVTVEDGEGTWEHVKIPNARKGQHLRVVLTKDGVVVSIVRAVFK